MLSTSIFMVLVAVSVPVGGNAASDGAAWSKDYGQSLQAAKTARKPLIVVIENGSDPQQSFDESLLGDKLARSGNFALCRIDASTDYGRLVADAFQAEQFPFAAISTSDVRRIAFRKHGQMSEQEWKDVLARAGSEPQRHSVQRVDPSTDGWMTQPIQRSSRPVGNCPNCRYR